tara:strand:+ start:16762 stop:16923 length:162 start_codon:yes stop_codon:yes gene_type:complete
MFVAVSNAPDTSRSVPKLGERQLRMSTQCPMFAAVTENGLRALFVDQAGGQPS